MMGEILLYFKRMESVKHTCCCCCWKRKGPLKFCYKFFCLSRPSPYSISVWSQRGLEWCPCRVVEHTYHLSDWHEQIQIVLPWRTSKHFSTRQQRCARDHSTWFRKKSKNIDRERGVRMCVCVWVERERNRALGRVFFGFCALMKMAFYDLVRLEIFLNNSIFLHYPLF